MLDLLNNLFHYFNCFLDYLITKFGIDGSVQIISSFFLFVGAYLALISTKRKTAIDLITKNRIDWSNNLRERVTQLTAFAYELLYFKEINKDHIKCNEDTVDDEEISKIREQLNRDIIEFKLYLNPMDRNNHNIVILLENIEDELNKTCLDINYDQLQRILKDFNKEVQFVLKLEWEKIKREAGIKNHRIRDLIYFKIWIFLNPNKKENK